MAQESEQCYAGSSASGCFTGCNQSVSWGWSHLKAQLEKDPFLGSLTHCRLHSWLLDWGSHFFTGIWDRAQILAMGASPIWPLASWKCVSQEDSTEFSQAEAIVFCNLIMVVTTHPFCLILFRRSKLLASAHAEGEGITQGSLRAIFESCLPQTIWSLLLITSAAGSMSYRRSCQWPNLGGTGNPKKEWD